MGKLANHRHHQSHSHFSISSNGFLVVDVYHVYSNLDFDNHNFETKPGGDH